MNIKVPRAFGCQSQEGRLFCACSDGIIRVFATDNLQHLVSLSKPPPLGSTNIMAGNSKIKIAQNKETKFADVIAVAIDNLNMRAVALYSDKMMFVWDVKSLKAVTVNRSFYSHCGPIHDIQTVPNEFEMGLNQKAGAKQRCEEEDNLTKFVTCSSDRTIRFWHLVDPSLSHQKQSEITQCLARNAYCKDMSKMIFVRGGNDDVAEQDVQMFDHFKAQPLDRHEDGTQVDINDQDKVKEMVDSVRCVRLSPDGRHLASGDEVGNIRIHDLVGQEIEQTKFMESHDSEVISLSYSPELTHTSGQQPQESQRYFLASGGRDKTILVYDAGHDYEPFTDLGHHSSTITALHFNESLVSKKGTRIRPQIDLISGGADRNLVMKRLDLDKVDQCRTPEQLTSAGSDPNALFKHANCEICKDKILSMDVAKEAQYLVTGHDKSLCLWKLPTFEKIWEKRASSLQEESKGSKAEAGANTRTPL